MKKITLSILFVTIALVSQARDPYGFDREIFRAAAVTTVIVLFMYFILAIIRNILDQRLKNKIIDKGVSEEVSSTILRPTNADEGNANVKWFCLLGSLGGGLMIIHRSQPLGIHSVATLAFSLAVGFLAYHLITQQGKKKK